MSYKECMQCGKNLPISMFRPYGQGRKGVFRRCKSCESLNYRYKYLNKKSKLSEKEQNEIDAILGIYTALSNLGREVPSIKVVKTNRIQEYEKHITEVKERVLSKVTSNNVPEELMYWLNAPLVDKPPEYYIDIVYEELQNKYAPILRYNSETSMPERDDIYRETLHAILERFYEYEDKYGGD